MFKIKKIGIILFALFIVTIGTSTVFAATITEVKSSDSKITVSGTANGSDQVQVALFDTNKQPIYFGTVPVVNGIFNQTLDANFNLEDAKTYSVKVSNYNGEGLDTETFVAAEEKKPETKTEVKEETKVENTSEEKKVETNEKDETPKTGMKISVFEIILNILKKYLINIK